MAAVSTQPDHLNMKAFHSSVSLNISLCSVKMHSCAVCHSQNWLQYFFFLLFYSHFENFASFFFPKTLHTNPRIAHTKYKMPHISCKMKHCIHNITNTSQKQTFANTFGVILIHVRFVCVA